MKNPAVKLFYKSRLLRVQDILDAVKMNLLANISVSCLERLIRYKRMPNTLGTQKTDVCQVFSSCPHHVSGSIKSFRTVRRPVAMEMLTHSLPNPAVEMLTHCRPSVLI